MTMARRKEISLCSNNASDDEVQQDHLKRETMMKWYTTMKPTRNSENAQQKRSQTGPMTPTMVCHGIILREEIMKMKIYHGTILRKGMITKMMMARTTTIG